MHYLESPPGRTIHLRGKEWLYFSGTSYLGIPNHPYFQGWLVEGIKRYGTNFGGSRLSNIQLDVYDRAERVLAKWTGAPAALTLSSGSLAGQTLLKFLERRGPLLAAPGTHPALWGKEGPKESNFTKWTEKVQKTASKKSILLMSSVDPLKAKNYPLHWLSKIRKDLACTLVVDDSHGIGVLGPQGKGVYQALSSEPSIIPIVMASMGKALGVPAGVILGPMALIEEMKVSPYFGGASPSPPAFLHAFLKAQELYVQQHQKLLENIALFYNGIQELAIFSFEANYPVFATDRHDLVGFLAERKMMISSFPYPTPDDEQITRIVISAAHKREDIERLLEHIRDFVS